MPGTLDSPLQPVLDDRRRREEEKQRNFGACRRALVESTSELERLIGERRRSIRDVGAWVYAGRPADRRLRDAHLRCVEVAIYQERGRRTSREAACNQARDELLLARRELRAIETLIERRLRAFEAEEARRDELDVDEDNARRRERAARERPARRRSGTALR